MTFTGIIPALLTPFDGGLRLALAELDTHARRLQTAGIEHVVVCGTMGEAASLTTDERRAVIDTALATGLTVTVGVSAATTGAVVDNVEQAADAGAHGVMCLPPTTYAPTERELHAWYGAITGAVPVMAYNNPEASRLDMPAELIASLRGITAVKECSGDARRIAHLLELAGDRLEVLIGGDDWALEGYAAGAVGWVSGVANVMPRECLELERAVTAGDLAAARAIWPKLAPLSRLDMDPRLVQSFKAALDLTGGYGGPVRPPRLPLDDTDMDRVRAAL
ncbi:MAG: 1-pyrroline-4-hydroxy-2-carboxylate deaminase [Solirubrobacteraceae bacterium]|nr:1-pyrroline-4-hydroxy-2-carboxylate deaminase [Solirubrobacteraceae bacterium]